MSVKHLLSSRNGNSERSPLGPEYDKGYSGLEDRTLLDQANLRDCASKFPVTEVIFV